MSNVSRMQASDTMTTAEAAARLGRTTRTIARMAEDGRLKPAKKLAGLRGDYLFWTADVERLARELAEAAAS